MSHLNVLIEQMTADMATQAMDLEDVRLKMFLEWLNAHSSKVKVAIAPEAQTLHLDQADVASIRGLKAGLQTWFESLPMQGMLWEYHLILDEIAWWRDLDAHRLSMILGSEAGS